MSTETDKVESDEDSVTNEDSTDNESDEVTQDNNTDDKSELDDILIEEENNQDIVEDILPEDERLKSSSDSTTDSYDTSAPDPTVKVKVEEQIVDVA